MMRVDPFSGGFEAIWFEKGPLLPEIGSRHITIWAWQKHISSSSVLLSV